MARQITDVHRPVTVPFPAKKVNWKRLMLWIVLACVVVGGSVGGYYLYDYVTSTVDLPKPPVKPGVVTPATPTETTAPAQSSDQMPVLEVTWEEIKLPPLKYGYDDISGFLVENGGNTSPSIDA